MGEGFSFKYSKSWFMFLWVDMFIKCEDGYIVFSSIQFITNFNTYKNHFPLPFHPNICLGLLDFKFYILTQNRIFHYYCVKYIIIYPIHILLYIVFKKKSQHYSR